jgi:hypothetical protein
MWRDGTLLVVRKGETFPDRCVKSNLPAHGRRVQQAAERGYAMPFLVHFWNPIAGVLIERWITKSVTFSVGLSDEWCRKRRRAFCLAGGITIVSFAAMAYGISLIGDNWDVGMWLVSLGLLSSLGGLLYGLNASTLVTASRITENYFWLKGVHPDFLADLPEWPGELWADITRFPPT